MEQQLSNLNRLEGFEVLQPSNLDKYSWPLADPTLTHQPSRQWTPEDGIAVATAARRTRLTPERVQRETAHFSTVAECIQWILAHDDFNFNGVLAVRNEPKWKARLATVTANNKPIHIAFPLFCCIANTPKQLTRPGPNAGELATILFFQHLDSLVRAIYEPGIVVDILSDATLYNNALQNTLAFANAYIAKAQAMVREAGAANCVVVHDYAALLAPHVREFDALYNTFYKRLLAGDESLISAEERARLLRSIRASVNTERFGLTYEDQRALFGPNPDVNHPLAAELERMAQAALRDQLAVKLACVELDLPNLLWPDHIRASCHKGIKSGVAVVGLRCYIEYYRRSHLLPYHGKPLLRADNRLIVEPEFTLRGRHELTRIENEHGESLLYIE